MAVQTPTVKTAVEKLTEAAQRVADLHSTLQTRSGELAQQRQQQQQPSPASR